MQKLLGLKFFHWVKCWFSVGTVIAKSGIDFGSVLEQF